MATMPIEIVDIGNIPEDQVSRAIAMANAVQSEFDFQQVPEKLASRLRIHAFRRVTTADVFDLMSDFRRSVRGYHPYIIAIVDSYLTGKKLANIFGSQKAKDGLAIVTIANVPGVVVPPGRLASYFIYYMARWTLSFVSPEHKGHDETRGCVFDRKINKLDITRSMRARALCDDCRATLLSADCHMSPQQFSALDALFAASGEALEEERMEGMTRTDKKARIFVGSSVEGLSVARAIQAELGYDYHIELWNQSEVFRLGTATLESLEMALDVYDYAIFVFTPDDQVSRRKEQAKVARDNVIFEAGLFIGRKGRLNAFIVHPRDLPIQLPSDLFGISTAKYEAQAPSLSAAVGAACQEIRAAISGD